MASLTFCGRGLYLYEREWGSATGEKNDVATIERRGG